MCWEDAASQGGHLRLRCAGGALPERRAPCQGRRGRRGGPAGGPPVQQSHVPRAADDRVGHPRPQCEASLSALRAQLEEVRGELETTASQHGECATASGALKGQLEVRGAAGQRQPARRALASEASAAADNNEEGAPAQHGSESSAGRPAWLPSTPTALCHDPLPKARHRSLRWGCPTAPRRLPKRPS